ERKAEILARGALGLREVALAVAEIAERRLEVQRRLVVRSEADADLAERRGEAIPLRGANAVHVVDVARLVRWQLDDVAQAELRVARRRLAALSVPAVESGQENAQHCRLQGVEARVVADVLEVLLRARAVEPKYPDALSELLVVDGDQPAVAEREQV